MKRAKIGLALGSGGARGLAHIGVIKILEKNNIPIDFIAGSSIGAMVGGFYASGLSSEKIEEIALSTNWKKMFSLVDPYLKQGLVSGKKVKKYIENYVEGKNFDDCLIPFSAVATDLKTGEIIVLNKGDLASSIRASISVPLVFKPEEIDGKMLADGGLSAPVPVEVVRNMGADIVIAVNLDKHYIDDKWDPKWYGIANNSLDILRHHLALSNSKDAEIIIEMDLGKDYWYKFVNGKDKILVGEKATKKILPQLKKMIHEKNNDYLGKFFDLFKL